MRFLVFLLLASCGMVATDSPNGSTRALWVGGQIAATTTTQGSEIKADMEQSLKDAATAAVLAYALNMARSVAKAESADDVTKAKIAERQATSQRAIDSRKAVKLGEQATSVQLAP